MNQAIINTQSVTQSVGDCFSFAKHLNDWYEDTYSSGVYTNVVTGKSMTQQQIFDEWVKLKTTQKHVMNS